MSNAKSYGNVRYEGRRRAFFRTGDGEDGTVVGYLVVDGEKIAGEVRVEGGGLKFREDATLYRITRKGCGMGWPGGKERKEKVEVVILGRTPRHAFERLMALVAQGEAAATATYETVGKGAIARPDPDYEFHIQPWLQED